MTAVVLRKVAKAFEGRAKVDAVKCVDLEIERGTRMAIVGASGSGKSTLLSMIGTLEAPSTGEIVLSGRNLASLSDRKLSRLRAQEIGFVFQSFHLLPRLTAEENVAEALAHAGVTHRDRKTMAMGWLNRVGLGERASHYPNQLSGGEQQRVALARALSTEPSLVLADEPTGNLDRVAGELVLDLLLNAVRPEATVLVVTHDERVASRMDTVIKMDAGRIVGSPAR